MSLSGFVLADKEAGLSSNGLVGRLRRELGAKRVGHTGTLDRFADGLMLLLVGRATSLAEFFLHKDKSYRAIFSLGKSTDTHDPEGKTQLSWAPDETRKAMQEKEAFLRQRILGWKEQKEQVPPLYSALKKGGRRYSDLARLGQRELPKKRSIQVYNVDIVEFNIKESFVCVDLRVSGGTYIRSFARDLSEESGIPVHLSRLTRLAIGDFSLEEEGVWRLACAGSVPILRDVSGLFPKWPRVEFCESQSVLEAARYKEDIRCGRLFALPSLTKIQEDENFFIVESLSSGVSSGGQTLEATFGSDKKLPSSFQIQTLAWAQKKGTGFVYKRIFL